MIHEKSKFVTITLVLALVLLTAAPAAAFQSSTRIALTDSVDLLFAEWDNEDTPGASVGIFLDGRIAYAKGYGMANLEHDIPLTPRSVFRIGSVSKQFTAMCAALLIEEGKVSPKNKINLFFPELPEYPAPITVKHLLHHLSGIRDYLTLMGLVVEDEHYRSEDAVRMLLRQKGTLYTPGERYSYANSGYLLLSELVARVSGKKTSQFAQECIFEPLGMTHTHFHDDLDRVVKNRASGYRRTPDGDYTINMTTLDIIGDGSVYTTIEDFFLWDQNFYDNVLGDGSQALIDLMLTNGVLNNGEKIRYAFGVNVDRYRGLKRVSHGGSWVGFRALYVQFPEQRFSVVVFTNNSISPEAKVRRIVDMYLRDAYTEPPPPEERRTRQPPSREPLTKPKTLTPAQLGELTGVYYSPELDEYATIRMEDESLTIKLGMTYGTLVSLSPETALWYNRRLEFARDAENVVTGMTMNVDGAMNLDFDKIH